MTIPARASRRTVDAVFAHLQAAIVRGELEIVLPEWTMPQGVAHFVYASRRGLLPGVRAFVDFLAERLPETMRLKHEQCRQRPD